MTDLAGTATASTPTQETAIRLAGLTKVFGSTTVVDHLDLDIGKGEFFSLLGPSGCGKTTTLRMIAGFSDATEGSILIGGTDVTSVPPHKRPVNTVFQSYALFEHLDVTGNVGFGLRRKGLPKAEISRMVGDALELVQLSEKATARPRELSGGQKQRVALARALVNRPEVLLLDEPLAALDLKLRHQMQVELKTIQREVGITFVFVTHDQDEALTLSDRVAIMNNGVIEQVGTPEDVYERPRTAFAAGFIGTSNLMTGTYEHGALDVGARHRGARPRARRARGGRDRIDRRATGEDLDVRVRARHGAHPRHGGGHRLPRRDDAVPRRRRAGRTHHGARAEPQPRAQRGPLERRRPHRAGLEARARGGHPLTRTQAAGDLG